VGLASRESNAGIASSRQGNLTKQLAISIVLKSR